MKLRYLAYKRKEKEKEKCTISLPTNSPNGKKTREIEAGKRERKSQSKEPGTERNPWRKIDNAQQAAVAELLRLIKLIITSTDDGWRKEEREGEWPFIVFWR